MSIWQIPRFCLIIIFSFVTARGQSVPTSPGNYSELVGRWVGTYRSLQGDDRASHPVEISISLPSKSGRLRMEYVYGPDGNKGLERNTRYLTLNPAKEELSSSWDYSAKDVYKTVGLDAFAKAGHGTFVAAQKTIVDGHSRTDICVYSLEGDAFTYHWKMTLDGKNFQPVSTFSLKRLPSHTPLN